MQGRQEFMEELQKIVRENDQSRKIDRIKQTAQRMAALSRTYADAEYRVQKTAESLERRITDAADTPDAAECHRKFKSLIPRIARPPGRLVDRGLIDPRQRKLHRGEAHRGHDGLNSRTGSTPIRPGRRERLPSRKKQKRRRKRRRGKAMRSPRTPRSRRHQRLRRQKRLALGSNPATSKPDGPWKRLL